MAGEQRQGKARLVGINHVALEVGDIDQALAFWGRLFEVTLRGRSETMAFIDLGDQFIALSTGRTQAADEHRHFGLVVDDRAAIRRTLDEIGVKILPGRGLDFLDPWGNRIQVVDYRDIQFTKAPQVLGAMGLGAARQEPRPRSMSWPERASGFPENSVPEHAGRRSRLEGRRMANRAIVLAARSRALDQAHRRRGARTRLLPPERRAHIV